MSLYFTTPPVLPYAFIGVPYSQQLQVAGGSGAQCSFRATYNVQNSWTFTAFGLFTSTPVPTTATYSNPYNLTPDQFTVTATDPVNGQTATQTFYVNVVPQFSALSILTTSLPSAQQALPYSQQLQGTGGFFPSWSLQSSQAVNTYNVTTGGLLTSTPTVVTGATPDSLTLAYTDQLGNTTSVTLTVVVTGLVIPASAAPYQALITSEHNQKPKFMAMIGVTTGALGDMTALMDSLSNLFDLDLAVGQQLDMIGRWVGQSRVVANISIPGFFGFTVETGAYQLPLTMGDTTQTQAWNASYAGPLYEAGATYQTTTTLADSDYRTVLRARIVRNQYNGTLVQLESALQYVLGVPCSVQDNGARSFNITISKPITATQVAILTALDILPRPAGITIGAINYASH